MSTMTDTQRTPPAKLAEQKRIAGILDAADALRAKRREALAQLDTLLQSTFLEGCSAIPSPIPMGRWGRHEVAGWSFDERREEPAAWKDAGPGVIRRQQARGRPVVHGIYLAKLRVMQEKWRRRAFATVHVDQDERTPRPAAAKDFDRQIRCSRTESAEVGRHDRSHRLRAARLSSSSTSAKFVVVGRERRQRSDDSGAMAEATVPGIGLLHHSDQGVHVASADSRLWITAGPSMSRWTTPKSFFSSGRVSSPIEFVM